MAEITLPKKELTLFYRDNKLYLHTITIQKGGLAGYRIYYVVDNKDMPHVHSSCILLSKDELQEFVRGLNMLLES
jgi:hypothetical protein